MANLRVLENRVLSPETFVLKTEKPNIEVRAGQCFSLGTSDLGINREYSIYSGADQPYLEFLIRKVPEGRVSHALSESHEGDIIQVGGPYGEFCLDESLIPNSRFIFFATGTGIAPFHSFSATYPSLNFEIHHGIRFLEEQYDRQRYPSGSYFPYISRPTDGQVGEYVTNGAAKLDLRESDVFYLCGNRNMINDIINVLRSKKVNGSSIFTETFF